MDSALRGLIDKKIRNILEVFIANKDELFHLQKISKLSNVSLTSSFRLIKKLVNLELITTIKIGKFKVYKLAENKKTRFLSGVLGK